MKTHLVTTLKRKATKILAELEEEGTPVLITEHGKPAAYLVDVRTFETLQNRIRILEGIARGEKAIQQGRVLTHTGQKKNASMARVLWAEPALLKFQIYLL